MRLDFGKQTSASTYSEGKLVDISTEALVEVKFVGLHKQYGVSNVSHEGGC